MQVPTILYLATAILAGISYAAPPSGLQTRQSDLCNQLNTLETQLSTLEADGGSSAAIQEVKSEIATVEGDLNGVAC